MRNLKKSHKRVLVFILEVLAVLILLCIFPWDSGKTHSFYPDGEYLIYGIRGYPSSLMPLRSVFGAFWEFHLSAGAKTFLPLLMGVISLSLVFSLGWMLCSRLCGIIAMAVSVPLVLEGAEPVYNLVILIVANFAVLYAQDRSLWTSIFLGLSVGLSLLCRSPLFLFPFVLIVAGWLGAERKNRWNVFFKRSLPMLFFSFLLLGPWVRMNWLLQGRFIPFEQTAAHSNLITGALGITKTVEGDAKKLAGIGHDENVYVWAFGETMRHPLRYAASVLRRLKLIAVLHPILIVMMLAGAWIFHRRQDYRNVSLLAGYFIGVHCLLAIEERYFIPVWPIAATLGACVITNWIECVEKRPKIVPAAIAIVNFAAVGILCLVVLWKVMIYPKRCNVPPEIALKTALKKNPGNGWLWHELGLRLLKRKETEKSAGYLSRAWLLEPGNKAWELDYAWALMVRGRTDFIDSVALAGHSFRTISIARGYLLKAVGKLLEGEKSQAHNLLETARLKHRRQECMFRSVGSEYEAQMQDKMRSVDDRLECIIRDILRLWPAKERLHILRSMPNAKTQYAETALQFELEVVSAHIEVGEKKKAVRMLDLMNKVNLPRRFEKRIITLYISAREFEKAYQELGKFLKKYPKDKFVIKGLRHIGHKYQKAGRYQSALKLFDGLVHANPSDEHLLNDRGVIYALMGKDEQAINDLRRGIEINSRFLPAYLTLGGIYASKGKIQQAYEIYDKALHQKGVSKGELLRLIKQEHDKLKRNLSQQGPR